MMYPYMTLWDGTEVVHSDIRENDQVYVHFERPVDLPDRAFDEATCVLPEYEWKERIGYSDDEMALWDQYVRSNAHLFYKYAACGGIKIA